MVEVRLEEAMGTYLGAVSIASTAPADEAAGALAVAAGFAAAVRRPLLLFVAWAQDFAPTLCSAFFPSAAHKEQRGAPEQAAAMWPVTPQRKHSPLRSTGEVHRAPVCPTSRHR